MKNQFYDTFNCSPLEIVCFMLIKSCLFDKKKRFAIYGTA